MTRTRITSALKTAALAFGLFLAITLAAELILRSAQPTAKGIIDIAAVPVAILCAIRIRREQRARPS